MGQTETGIRQKELSTEERLRAEVEELRRQLEEQKRSREQPAPPSRLTLGAISMMGVIAIATAFFAGYLPHRHREELLAAESRTASETLPTVTVVRVRPSPARADLVLPGNIQALTEAPVLARASGYIRKRYADIGDRVQAGQLLAEIDAPELDQQVRQAKAAVQQAQSSLEQAAANLQQGKTNEELARVTAQRWKNLESKGVVSRQENDTYQAQYQAQTANVQALEKALAAARNSVSAAEANVARLTDLQSYRLVRAPFSGVITLRNIDVGALITESSTLLFRIAQTNLLRTFLNVPQADADAVHLGQTARILISDLPGKQFEGAVTRTSNALDPATRTLLVEVQVPNRSEILLPGMYAQVDLTVPGNGRSLLIPGDTLVVRPDGTQVAMLGPDNTIHFQRIELGRDYGDKIEVVSGLQADQEVVVNPGDVVREGVKVNPVLLQENTGKSTARGSR
ncbi:MAG TPA: efflux RND transporter periplasmic adaptor subunit [Bryobacteraceae bacterium]|nr:efflux RND transporter periplasmic adaptor subunit [Bryobacteraceae bacterium]